ncbi:anthrone oxygenase family protein [Nonomuraea sp. CA-141351]|uniref:anthrone oxygenase family protein n=1 Tax=Nonomuraea sp. CA-141351 TaxID=3239996 RepID=UPI003D8AD625
MWSTILTGISLAGSGVQAGALLMFLFGICPTFRSVDVPDWMRIHTSMDRSIERYMPVLNVVTGGTTLILLFLPQDGVVRLLRVAALICNVALALISELANVRLNKVIARKSLVLVGAGGSSASDETQRMAEIRDRWIAWHWVRTLVITTGFLLYIVAAILR